MSLSFIDGKNSEGVFSRCMYYGYTIGVCDWWHENGKVFLFFQSLHIATLVAPPNLPQYVQSYTLSNQEMTTIFNLNPLRNQNMVFNAPSLANRTGLWMYWQLDCNNDHCFHDEKKYLNNSLDYKSISNNYDTWTLFIILIEHSDHITFQK